jgi:hypothetical protein
MDDSFSVFENETKNIEDGKTKQSLATSAHGQGENGDGFFEPKTDKNSSGTPDQEGDSPRSEEDDKPSSSGLSTVRLSFGKHRQSSVSEQEVKKNKLQSDSEEDEEDEEEEEEEELGDKPCAVRSKPQQHKNEDSGDDESESSEDEEGGSSLLLQFKKKSKEGSAPSSASPLKTAESQKNSLSDTTPKSVPPAPTKPEFLVKILAEMEELEKQQPSKKKKKRDTTPQEDFKKYGIMPEPNAPVFEHRVFQNMSQLFNKYKTGKTFVKTNTVDPDMTKCHTEYAEYMKYWESYCAWAVTYYPKAYRVHLLKRAPTKAAAAAVIADATLDKRAGGTGAPRGRKPKAQAPKTKTEEEGNDDEEEEDGNDSENDCENETKSVTKKVAKSAANGRTEPVVKRARTSADSAAFKSHFNVIQECRRREETHLAKILELMFSVDFSTE